MALLAGCGASGLQQADPKLPANCTREPNQEPHCVQGSDIQVAAVHNGDSCAHGQWVAGQTNFDGSVTFTCRNVTLERAHAAATTVAADLNTVTSETSQAHSDVTQVFKTLQGLRNDQASILKDDQAAARSNCTQLFPDAPDSPDIGADSVLQGLSQLSSDTAQLQTDSAAYRQVADAAPAAPALDDATVTAAINAANQAVKSLTPQIQQAESEAEQIIKQEKQAANAPGC